MNISFFNWVCKNKLIYSICVHDTLSPTIYKLTSSRFGNIRFDILTTQNEIIIDDIIKVSIKNIL